MGNIVKIQEIRTKKGTTQFIVTIPKSLANAYTLSKGDRVEFKINSSGRLEIIKIK